MSAAANPRFRAAFLAPRFWGTWAMLLTLRIVMYLPRRLVMILGAWFGSQVLARNAKRRRIAEVNLSLCFPQLTADERARLLAAHFRDYGRGMLDMGLTLWASPARLGRICQMKEGAEWRRRLGEGMYIVVAYHLTTLDMSGAILNAVRPYTSLMKRDRNPLLTWQLWRGRCHLHPETRVFMRDQGLRPLMRAMRPGRVCVFIPDEDFGNTQHTVFAPFFGVPTSTLTVVSRMARLTGAQVLPSATHLDPRTGRYTMTIGEPLGDFPGADPAADAAALNRAMESLVQRAPQQYMWTFRWFKTRPHGAANPYD